MIAFLVLAVTGCGHLAPSIISADGSPVEDAARIAVLSENVKRPLLLRGVDGKLIDSLRIPNPFFNYAYAISPGRHALWVVSPAQVLGAYPIPTGPMRCYVIEAELLAGEHYVLEEDASQPKALLTLQRTAERVASGALVDQFWTGTRTCRWR